ncbi:diguanylate cyclase/phosphodiesterase (GGDEF & EAL domains) with PAS/PAC sensor(s) [hydrothermal vent metagenome]|jgi:diguanylate cyclase (GGDEF)-like protein/PAS domain S-box-containing protein|uniref:Diguanylate cyclase/phosphodiesterase (GGDEF & EAL domains) with PAS/PAC sensor(S) n=1 Tax=hydrothermal vent metagenome TaxID=652676 RepID=A0A160TJL5_9ZZZZ
MMTDGGIGALERELRTSRQMFRAAFHAAATGKAIVDVTGICVEVNAALAALLGHAPDALAGMHFADFTHPHDIRADLHLFEEVMRGERDSYQMEKRYLHKDGSVVHVLLTATVVREEDGTPISFLSEVVDLTERLAARQALQEANRRLQHQVVTDHLTGLYNRRGFEEALAGPLGHQASLLLIDLDHFKHINDRLGHRAGDLVLAEVGRRLPRQIRDGDFVARVGGDEFGIIMHHADRALAERTAARIVKQLGTVYEVDGAFAHIGASVGVSCTEDGDVSLRELVCRADEALYAAKRAGRSRWQLSA